MFYEDDTFNFHNEIMSLAEEFCQEWVQRRGPFESKLKSALILNFAFGAIKHDLEEILNQIGQQPVFEGLSPREVYERGEYGKEPSRGLSEKDIIALMGKSLQRIHRN